MGTTNIDHNILKETVIKSGLKTEFIAKEVGISAASLRALLRGQQNASMPVIKLLSQTLKIEVDALLRKAS